MVRRIVSSTLRISPFSGGPDKMGATDGYIDDFEAIVTELNLHLRLRPVPLMNPEVAHFAGRNALDDDDRKSPADGDIALAGLDDPGPETPADVPILRC